MFTDQNQHSLWNPNKYALVVLLIGVTLLLLRLSFPVYVCQPASGATYIKTKCQRGQVVSFSLNTPVYKPQVESPVYRSAFEQRMFSELEAIRRDKLASSNGITAKPDSNEISFYKASPFYTYTQGIVLLILFSLLYLAAQRNLPQNLRKTLAAGISGSRDREIPVENVVPTAPQTKRDGSSSARPGILTRIETYLQKQQVKNQTYVESHTLKWTFFAMIGLLVFTVALKMGGAVDWDKQVFYFAVATFFIGGNFGRVLAESGISREKRLKAGTLATAIFIISILVLTV